MAGSVCVWGGGGMLYARPPKPCLCCERCAVCLCCGRRAWASHFTTSRYGRGGSARQPSCSHDPHPHPPHPPTPRPAPPPCACACTMHQCTCSQSSACICMDVCPRPPACPPGHPDHASAICMRALQYTCTCCLGGPPCNCFSLAAPGGYIPPRRAAPRACPAPQAVLAAVDIMAHPLGLHVSANKVTISTVGLLDEMRAVVRRSAAQVALSLHATTGECAAACMHASMYRVHAGPTCGGHSSERVSE